ncbi:hypothetical protein FKM82_024969 [Ascaphus truei]
MIAYSPKVFQNTLAELTYSLANVFFGALTDDLVNNAPCPAVDKLSNFKAFGIIPILERIGQGQMGTSFTSLTLEIAHRSIS